MVIYVSIKAAVSCDPVLAQSSNIAAGSARPQADTFVAGAPLLRRHVFSAF